MGEEIQFNPPPQEPHADVPPRLIYEAAFTARNTEGPILESNARYFYLGQVGVVGYMIFEVRNWLQGSLDTMFLVLILTLCGFALGVHAVYSEIRMSDSFKLIEESENLCEYYEKHAYINPALYFYAKPGVRVREERSNFFDFQLKIVVALATMWLFFWIVALVVAAYIILFRWLT